VRDGDLISLLRARPAAPGAAPAQAPQAPAMPPRNADGSLADPQAFIRGLLASPATLAAIPPALADAARRGDVAALNGFFRRAGGSCARARPGQGAVARLSSRCPSGAWQGGRDVSPAAVRQPGTACAAWGPARGGLHGLRCARAGPTRWLDARWAPHAGAGERSRTGRRAGRARPGARGTSSDAHARRLALQGADTQAARGRHLKQREDAAREEEALYAADAFDPEAQARIAERIQQAAVEESYQHALDHAPEIFTKVVMLYVNVQARAPRAAGPQRGAACAARARKRALCAAARAAPRPPALNPVPGLLGAQVNGQPIRAFVDSGAQSSIMSQACAERCNLLRLLDRRFAGMAVGVGTGTIVGQIHQARAPGPRAAAAAREPGGLAGSGRGSGLIRRCFPVRLWRAGAASSDLQPCMRRSRHCAQGTPGPRAVAPQGGRLQARHSAALSAYITGRAIKAPGGRAPPRAP
jgi:hypothetical protein